jgi:hypothetical protein
VAHCMVEDPLRRLSRATASSVPVTPSMTLVLQVNDGVTGTLLAVALDKRRSGSSTMQWATSVSNRAAAEQMLKGWAEQLKRELDAVRAK